MLRSKHAQRQEASSSKCVGRLGLARLGSCVPTSQPLRHKTPLFERCDPTSPISNYSPRYPLHAVEVWAVWCRFEAKHPVNVFIGHGHFFAHNKDSILLQTIKFFIDWRKLLPKEAIFIVTGTKCFHCDRYKMFHCVNEAGCIADQGGADRRRGNGAGKGEEEAAMDWPWNGSTEDHT